MKAILVSAIILICSTTAFAAERELTDKEKMQLSMETNNISYIWRDEDHGPIIAVFNETDPRNVREMGDQFPGIAIDFVRNFHTDVTAYCKVMR